MHRHERFGEKAAYVDADVPEFDASKVAALRELQEPGEDDFVAQLLDHFVGQMPSRLDTLDQAVRAGDAGQVERLAHSLRSSCASLGVMRMSHICKQTELRAAEGRLEGALAASARLRQEFTRVRPRLEATRAEAPRPPRPTMP
jgi:HPt (histidine-containing phosphotransfer) domain-containing protein